MFRQWEGIASTDLALTELAFLKDTLVTTPIGNTNLYQETELLLTFEIEYESCGAVDLGCHLKNAMLWLLMDSPISQDLWEKYGTLFNETYNVARTQQDIIDTLDTSEGENGLLAIVTVMTALISLMIYTFIQRVFK